MIPALEKFIDSLQIQDILKNETLPEKYQLSVEESLGLEVWSRAGTLLDTHLFMTLNKYFSEHISSSLLHLTHRVI